MYDFVLEYQLVDVSLCLWILMQTT